MKILFLASTPYSHILPLSPLFAELINKGNVVYCMTDKKNKELVNQFNVKFLEYPFDFERDLRNIDYNVLIYKMRECFKKGQYENGYIEYMKGDITGMYNILDNDCRLIKNIIEKYHIDIIFRDAVEKIGFRIAGDLGIPCIGYITHNLYTKKYFLDNAIEKTIVFLAARENMHKVSKNFLINYYNIYEQMNKKISYELNEYPLYPLHQFDPRNEFNIVFSTETLQPSASLCTDNKKYLIIYPQYERFMVEKDVEEGLKKFIEKKEKIVCITSGTITTQTLDYYIKFINLLVKMKYRVVLSCPLYIEVLNEYIKENHLEKDVYISRFLPQKYVLSHSLLFITSGGQNSILESIFYKVPMLVTPMTSEQRLNGLQVRDMGIGETTYQYDNKKVTMGRLIDSLVNDDRYRRNINNCYIDLINHVNDFSAMWEYINKDENIKYNM